MSYFLDKAKKPIDVIPKSEHNDTIDLDAPEPDTVGATVEVESDLAGGDAHTMETKATEPVDYGGAKPKTFGTGVVNPWDAKKNQDYWNQKYAVQPDHHRLYGGKMTDARMHEAKVVTQAAVEKLHR